MDRATQVIRRAAFVLPAIGFRASHAQDAPFVRDVFQQINTQRQLHHLDRFS